MDPETFNAVQPLLDKIAERAEEQFGAEELHRLMADLANAVGNLPNRSHNEHSLLSKGSRRKHLCLIPHRRPRKN
jgi:hypothetical protein